MKKLKTIGSELNKGLNWKAIPDKFIVKSEEPGVIKEIPIGTVDPVLKFKEWNKKYCKKMEKGE